MPEDPLADRLGPLLGRAHDTLRRETLSALAPLGLSPKGYGALLVLDAAGEPLRQQRLAERQGIDRTTAVAVVDELERLGAVERRRDAADRRAYALELTGEGRRLLAAGEAAVIGSEERFLQGLESREREALKDTLRRLLAP